MKKGSLILIVLMLTSLAGLAQNQFPSQIWHKGNIFLADGSSYSGLLKYDMENNVVQVQADAVETFTAINVTRFEIFDETYGGLRMFYSLPYSLNGQYETPIFFEVLTQGDNIALLCREYVAVDTRGMNNFGPMAMNPFWGAPNFTGYRLAFTYYFLKAGKLEKFSLKKKDLFSMLPGYDNELNLFMRKNRLEHDKRGDLLRITAYYNELKN
jgi:hypothetical protein